MQVQAYYYHDKDQAFLLSDSAYREVEKARMHGLPINTGGHVLYPIFEPPTDKEKRLNKTKTPAWLIQDGGCPAVRWYWQIREHKKGHNNCKVLGDGLCGFKMVRFAEWNDEAKKWELLPMINHADSVQEKVLDTN